MRTSARNFQLAPDRITQLGVVIDRRGVARWRPRHFCDWPHRLQVSRFQYLSRKLTTPVVELGVGFS